MRAQVDNFLRLAIILAHIIQSNSFQSGILRSDFFHGALFLCFCCCLRNIKNKSSLIPNQIVFTDWISSFSNLILKFWDFLRIVDVKKLGVLDGKKHLILQLCISSKLFSYLSTVIELQAMLLFFKYWIFLV